MPSICQLFPAKWLTRSAGDFLMRAAERRFGYGTSPATNQDNSRSSAVALRNYLLYKESLLNEPRVHKSQRWAEN